MGRSTIISAAVLGLFALAGRAQDWTQHFYANLGAGYFFQDNATVEASASNGASSTALGSGTSKFDPGFRGDIRLGYHINKVWSVELNTGALLNTSDFEITSGIQKVGVQADTYTIPFLANVVYKIPVKNRFSAYVGLGAGGAASMSSFSSSLFDPNDNAFIFAYQAEIGLRYALSKNMSCGIGYEFLGATDPTWKFTIPGGPGGIPPSTEYSFKEKGFYTHSINIVFSWTF